VDEPLIHDLHIDALSEYQRPRMIRSGRGLAAKTRSAPAARPVRSAVWSRWIIEAGRDIDAIRYSSIVHNEFAL
jgi:hypothetical protein